MSMTTEEIHGQAVDSGAGVPKGQAHAEYRQVRKLTIIQATDTGLYAVSENTPTGQHAIGRLNFDQVVALLEKYFVFNDSDFKVFDQIWKVIDHQTAETEG